MQEPLSELLDHLKSEIEKSEQGQGDTDELARLVAEVERRLGEDDDEGVGDELREEATKFEADHPRVADVLRRTVDALSAIGL
jgi:hypothetical protein